MTALLLIDMNTHNTMRPSHAMFPRSDQDETVYTVGCKRRLDQETQFLPVKMMRTNGDSSNNNDTHSKKGRTVRFASEQPTVHLVPLVPNEDMHLVWYTTADFQHQRRNDFQWCHFYSQCEDDTYRNNLFQVLGTACGKLDHTTATDDATLALSSSHIRGLERETTVCFRQRKKQVVTNVLKSQASLRSWLQNRHRQDDNIPKMTEKESTEYSSRILATHYHKLAQPASRFARLLGMGDSQYATAR